MIKNKIDFKIIILVIIILLFSIGIYISITTVDTEIISDVNNNMGDIDSYEINSQETVYHNSQAIGESNIKTKINESVFYSNGTSSENGEDADIEFYGSDEFIYSKENGSWEVMSDKPQNRYIIGLNDEFDMNKDKFEISRNILFDGYEATANFEGNNTENISELSNWYVIDELIAPNEEQYKSVTVTANINNEYMIDNIDIQFIHEDGSRYNIHYEISNINEEINITKPFDKEELQEKYYTESEPTDYTVDLSIEKSNDEIELIINDYSEDVKHIEINPFTTDEIVKEVEKDKVITLQADVDYNSDRDNIVISSISKDDTKLNIDEIDIN